MEIFLATFLKKLIPNVIALLEWDVDSWLLLRLAKGLSVVSWINDPGQCASEYSRSLLDETGNTGAGAGVA